MKRLWQDESGQTLIEYGMLVALISVVAIVILSVVGHKVHDTFSTVNGAMRTTS
jgi:pilus assembly protein Flp/PilA